MDKYSKGMKAVMCSFRFSFTEMRKQMKIILNMLTMFITPHIIFKAVSCCDCFYCYGILVLQLSVVHTELFGLNWNTAFYLCQQWACIIWPQLPVCVPHDRSGCMNNGSCFSVFKMKQKNIEINIYLKSSPQIKDLTAFAL